MANHFGRHQAKPRSRRIAAVLAIILGMMGAHKFYLGYKREGWILIGASCLCSVLFGITSTRGIGLLFLPMAFAEVEAIRYLLLNDDEFRSRYVDSKRGWL